MWELYRLFKPSGSMRVVSIIERVPPPLIAESIRILYGDPMLVTNGIMLLDCLYRGLEANHFSEFLTLTKRMS